METAKRIVIRLLQFNPLLNRYIIVQDFENTKDGQMKADNLYQRKLKQGLTVKLSRAVI